MMQSDSGDNNSSTIAGRKICSTLEHSPERVLCRHALDTPDPSTSISANVAFTRCLYDPPTCSSHHQNSEEIRPTLMLVDTLELFSPIQHLLHLAAITALAIISPYDQQITSNQISSNLEFFRRGDIYQRCPSRVKIGRPRSQRRLKPDFFGLRRAAATWGEPLPA